MLDIAELLDRTTPTDLPPPDLDAIAHRSRRRRTRRRVLATALPVAALLVVLGALAVGPRAALDPATQVRAGPDADLRSGAGRWDRGDDPPLTAGPGTFAGALPDGRVVVWDRAAAAGAILDLATGRWDTLPDAPLPAPPAGNPAVAINASGAQLAGGRLAVVTGTGDGARHAAVYNVASGIWTAAPEFGPRNTDAMAWDGDTLVLVRVGAADGSVAGATWRWRRGENHWTGGAPSPLTPRDIVGSAFDGRRLALFGGEAGGSTLPDGAVYDLAADTWTPIPPGPLGGRYHVTLVWSGGRLLVGGGLDRVADGDNLPDLAAYSPPSSAATPGAWEVLPPAPQGGVGSTRPASAGFVEGERVLVVADESSPRGRPEGRWVYGPAGWEHAPERGLADLGGYLAATANGDEDVPSALWLRDADGEWRRAADPPFERRAGVVTVASGTRLVALVGDTVWVFHPAG